MISNKWISDITISIQKEFKAYGTIIDKTEVIKSQILFYLNWRRRFIRQQKRRVLYSKELYQNKKFKKYKKIISKIEYKLKNAEDIIPYLSKGIIEKPYIKDSKSQSRDKDNFLNAFNIHHLHLGDINLNKNSKYGINFVERTQDLLFILLKENKVYFLDILEHDFYIESLFKIIKNNWSYITEPYRLHGILSSKINRTKTENKELLKAGVATMVEIDNELYALNELVTSGHNRNDVQDVGKLLSVLKNCEYNLLTNHNMILNSINELFNKDIAKLDIKIIIKEGKLYFFEKNSNTTLLLDYYNNKIGYLSGCCPKNSSSISFDK